MNADIGKIRIFPKYENSRLICGTQVELLLHVLAFSCRVMKLLFRTKENVDSFLESSYLIVKSGGNAMYWRFLKMLLISDVVSFIRGNERHLSLTIPRQIAEKEKGKVFSIYAKMLFSLLKTGCTFKEYYNLGFYKRSLKNQKTFITTGSNLIAYGIMNDASCNHVYINKDEFNTVYADFMAREWIKLSEDRQLVYDFFQRHKSVIVKPRTGDSGKGIFVIHDPSSLQLKDIDNIIAENKDGIVEEVLHNHSDLNILNDSSLNTLRIITIRRGEKLDILFAGIRYGAKGSEVDNISQGGYVAPIDIESGCICGQSYQKKTVTESLAEEQNYQGFQIPLWDKMPEYLMKLTSVVPQMRYMAWDIAITDNGFATIEGNHSSGNTIIQAHLGIGQEGLKNRLDTLMQDAL